MEKTSHIACLCKMCLYTEWLLLEKEINNVVFGYHKLCTPASYGDQPTKTLGKSAAVSDREYPAKYDRKLSPDFPQVNIICVPPRPPANRQKKTRAVSWKLSPDVPQVNICVPPRPKAKRQKKTQAVSWKLLPDVPQVNICVPPRPTAKRQKKTLADLERPEPPRSRRLHVSNIPFWFVDYDLIELFQGFGNVVQAEVIYNDRGSKGFGFVTFENEEESVNIKKLFNGLELHGRVLEVNYASRRRANKSRGPKMNTPPDKPKFEAWHQVAAKPFFPERARPRNYYCKSAFESRPRSSYLHQQQK